MENRLNWGSLAEAPKAGRWPRVHQGRALFVIRNGLTDFPQGDRRVWPWDAVTAVGYLNVEPTAFQVNIAGLTSKDGVPCRAVSHFEVQLKQEPEWRMMAASRQDGLYDSFCLIATECAQSTFKTFDFKALLLGEEAVREALAARLNAEVKSNTPYVVRRFVLDSIASMNPALDDSIRTAKAAEIGTVALARAAELEAELETNERQRLRNSEVADMNHEMSLKEKREGAERARRRLDKEADLSIGEVEKHQELRLSKTEREQNLALSRGEMNQRLEFAGSLHEKLSGDLRFYMGLEHPELYARMQMSDADSRREVAIALQQLMNAHAHDQGVTETLKRVMGQLQLGLNSDRLEISDLVSVTPKPKAKSADEQKAKSADEQKANSADEQQGS